MRKSSIITNHDAAGSYEVEIFDHPSPKSVIVCSHGNGVRRWDGEKFFYAVAEHYSQSAVLLVDQNQPDGDGVTINPLPILKSRVMGLIQEAKRRYPGAPVIVMGHSMGCGVASQLDVAGIKAIVFIAPGAGSPQQGLIERYGADIADGKAVTTSDGLKKVITAEYYRSVRNITWEAEYKKLVERFPPVYVFEAGADEIVGEERFAHREIPFASYSIIDEAKHNFSGAPLTKLFSELDRILVRADA